ncbi:MAG: phosphoglycolate phosphatase [Magnetococcales bacterium]|nr:phosphoglycolate phosphatase [Magnetococcales bacterium]
MSGTPAPSPLACRAILFDLDGTLVDTSQDLWRALNFTIEKRGFPPLEHPQVRDFVGHGARSLLARSFWGKDASPPEPNQDPDFDAALQDFLVHYAAHLADHSRPFPQVMETLTQLRQQGFTLGVVTNKPLHLTQSLLDQLAMTHYFTAVVGGGSLPHYKPDPQPLWHALEIMRISPTLAVMVGDAHPDVAAARAAGCPVVAVSYGYNSGIPVQELDPDRIVEDFSHLLTQLVLAPEKGIPSP